MRFNFTFLSLTLGIAVCAAVSAQTVPQDSDPVLQGSATYSMPQSAIDADIGGTVVIAIQIDKTGKPTRAQLYVGPMWPCGSTPVKAIEELKSTLSDAMLKLRFAPAIKNGKPVATAIALRIPLNNPLRTAKLPENVLPAAKPLPKTISAGVLNGKAKSLPVPAYPAGAHANGDSGAVSIQVLIDEKGKVVFAGAVSGAPTLQSVARQAACDAKFSPTTVSGFPVKVSGIITYNFNP